MRQRDGRTVGVVMQYRNGAVRDLGEWEVGMVLTKCVDNPDIACLNEEPKGDMLAGLDFIPSGALHDSEHDATMCRPIGGLLKVVWDPSPNRSGEGVISEPYWWTEHSDERVFPTDLRIGSDEVSGWTSWWG